MKNHVYYNKNDKKGIFYLSNCDLISKYNIKNVYCLPKIKKIVVELNFENFLNSFNSSAENQSNTLKGVITLYILTNLMPFINFHTSDVFSKTKFQDDKKYSLKIILNDTYDIHFFLFLLFVENWSKLIAEDFSLINKNKNFNSSLTNFVLRTSIVGSSFFDIQKFSGNYFTNLNTKTFSIKVNLLLSNKIKSKSPTNLVKNLSPIWIS